MGLFDTQTGFLYTTPESRSADIKGLFGDIGSGVKDIAHEGVGLFKDVVGTVFDGSEQIVSTVTGDIKDTVIGASNAAGGAIGAISSNLTMPLVIGAAIIGGVLLMKK